MNILQYRHHHNMFWTALARDGAGMAGEMPGVPVRHRMIARGTVGGDCGDFPVFCLELFRFE